MPFPHPNPDLALRRFNEFRGLPAGVQLFNAHLGLFDLVAEIMCRAASCRGSAGIRSCRRCVEPRFF